MTGAFSRLFGNITQQRKLNVPHDEILALTYVTSEGEIVTEQTDLYRIQPLIVQNSVDVHESVHVDQLTPFSGRGRRGQILSRIDYAFNKNEYEAVAYTVQLDYLDSVSLQSNHTKIEREILYFETQRVRHNLEILNKRLGKD